MNAYHTSFDEMFIVSYSIWDVVINTFQMHVCGPFPSICLKIDVEFLLDF